MSLLVTSCTMGEQPDRLLNKGPEYLRTRTNMGLFANHKRSAVELLAASKSQYYHHPGQGALDKQDLALSRRQSQRYNRAKIQQSPLQREPPRSKSHYDLSQILQLAEEEDEENDHNNNDTSDESIQVARLEVLERTKRLSLEDKGHPKRTSGHHQDAQQRLSVSASPAVEDNSTEGTETTPEVKTCVPSSSSSPAISKLLSRDKSETSPFTQNPPLSNRSKSQVLEHRVKPVVPPRKPKTKPVPLPRKYALRSQSAKQAEALSPTSTPKDKVEPTLKEGETFPTKCESSPHESGQKVHVSVVCQREKPKLKAATPKRKSLVESLTQHFTNLGSPSPSCASESPKSPIEVGVKPGSGDNVITYTATPIFITKPVARPKSVNLTDQEKLVQSSIVSPQSEGKPSVSINSRKRCPNVPASYKYSKRERKSSKPELTFPPVVNRSLSTPSSSEHTKAEPLERRLSVHTPSKPEMSIDSVDEAVDMSEVNAAPFPPEASSEFEAMEGGEDEDAREVSRTNSSLSGKLDPQDAMSPAVLCPSTVPRSHSDISCRLEGEHSRESSMVARLSRASVGADLEKFFNQMGMERGIIEPLAQLAELQRCEAFESVSSLDSHDAASICSNFSRSEQEWSESQSMDRLQQPTSVVERNARIIKWLCNVRKARVPPGSAKPEAGAAASGAV